MADGIHEYTATIVLWISGAWSDISEEIIDSFSFKCIEYMTFAQPLLLLSPSFLSFSLSFKVQSKIGLGMMHG